MSIAKLGTMDLLAMHLVGDYVTQTPHMAVNKLTDPKVRARHVTAYVAGFVPLVFLQNTSSRRKAAFLVSLWLSHFAIDSRRWASGEAWPPKPILVDQAIHAVQLALLERILR